MSRSDAPSSGSSPESPLAPAAVIAPTFTCMCTIDARTASTVTLPNRDLNASVLIPSPVPPPAPTAVMALILTLEARLVDLSRSDAPSSGSPPGSPPAPAAVIAPTVTCICTIDARTASTVTLPNRDLNASVSIPSPVPPPALTAVMAVTLTCMCATQYVTKPFTGIGDDEDGIYSSAEG